MKKFLLASVALAALGIGAPAIAADMAVRPVAPVRAFSWTGCHIGGLVGYEWGTDNGYTTTAGSTFLALGPTAATPPLTAAVVAGQPVVGSFNMSGFNGGGYAGCDYQFGSWVVGVEGDWSVVNKEGQARNTPNSVIPGLASSIGPIPFPATALVFGEAQERWYATARARLGYAVDKWLFFVSGGAAWTKVDDAAFQTNAGPIPAAFPGVVGFVPGAGGAPLAYQASSSRLTGWTVGAGVDYAPATLKGNWTVRAEYLYVHFDDYTAFGNPAFQGLVPTILAGTFTNLSTRLDNHIVRFGLAYKFGPTSYSQLYR